MAFPTSKTNAVDTETEIVAAHLNNLETKVGIDNSADPNSLDYEVKHHKTRHENGGADEISVGGLSGILAEAQTPIDHASSHENGGGDEISVTGLSGALADKQDANKIQGHTVDEAALGDDKVLVYKSATGTFVYEIKGTPSAHKASHENGGGDEISVAGLSGVLGDKQDANKIQGHTVDEAALGDDKVLVYKSATGTFVYEAKGTPAGHHTSHESGGGDPIKLDDLAVPDDNTDLDASTTKHGLMKKFPGGTTDFLRADGTFAAPPGGGGDFLVIQVFS